MRLDAITVALRTRTPWEATDLGIALVRTHARRIWPAWLLSTLPAFVLFNALALALQWPWLGGLALWWCKPAFDRVPLFVISRAVFGAAPSLRETLAAQWRWGWRALLPWLLWRRLHPGRAMLLPVDLLEGVRGAQRKQRVYVLSRAHASPNALLMLIGVNLEAMFVLAALLLALMFVPIEFFEPSVQAMWGALFEHPPWWAQIVLNGLYWLAMSIVEPFYVGAGFGLYLNRRMQLEAWDVELAFRRLAARLTPAPFAAAALLLLCLGAGGNGMLHAAPPAYSATSAKPADAKAQEDHPLDETDISFDGDDDAPAPKNPAKPDAKSDDGVVCKATDAPKLRGVPLKTLFADGFHDDGSADFEAAVKKAYADGELDPKIKDFTWRPRNRDSTTSQHRPSWAVGLGGVFGFIAEYGLWIVIGIGLLIVVLNHRRWLSWLSDLRAPAAPPLPAALGALPVAPEPLPDDVPAAVRALLAQGRMRAGLALLYRAAVARLVERLGAPLPPGATEADCLRRARNLADARYAGLFARIVRCWQIAAYAHRLPTAAEIDALLAEWNAPPPEAAA